jgi:hypothetical protein
VSRASDAASLKAFAVAWLRFARKFDIVCTEDPYRSADALGADSAEGSKRMTEIEVKVDMGDLRADAEKRATYTDWGMKKHEALVKQEEKDGEFTKSPSQFYFMVTKSILDKAQEYILKEHPHAGIIAADPEEANWERALTIVKVAPVLHKKKIDKNLKRRAQMRSTSELCGLLLKRHRDGLKKSLFETLKSDQNQ